MVTKRKKKVTRARQRGPMPKREKVRVSGRKARVMLREPAKSQFHPDGLNLDWLSYLMSRTLGVQISTHKVAGAIRALELVNDDTRYDVTMRGPVARRQQTWVHKSKLKQLEKHLEKWA